MGLDSGDQGMRRRAEPLHAYIDKIKVDLNFIKVRPFPYAFLYMRMASSCCQQKRLSTEGQTGRGGMGAAAGGEPAGRGPSAARRRRTETGQKRRTAGCCGAGEGGL